MGKLYKKVVRPVGGRAQDCEVQTPTGNTAPQAIAPADFTIPASTPFQLDAIGIDSDNDELTYCWEQIDEEIGEVMPPDPTNTLGPMFRSLPPTTERTRFMPDMLTVMQGLSANIWEVVPSVNRTMEFRVTVRDNAANGASSASDDVIVTVDSSSGPFIITSHNIAHTGRVWGTRVIWPGAGRAALHFTIKTLLEIRRSCQRCRKVDSAG